MNPPGSATAPNQVPNFTGNHLSLNTDETYVWLVMFTHRENQRATRGQQSYLDYSHFFDYFLESI